MKYWKLLSPGLLFAALCAAGGSISHGQTEAPVAEGAHGVGPNGGVVFDLGSHHAEFTVDHDKQECTILVLGADEKTPGPVEAAEFILIVDETKLADGTVLPPMTIVMLPSDVADGKAAKFIGTDPGIANVAEFSGTVTGDIDGKPITGNFNEAGGGHTPHSGIVAALQEKSGEKVGFVELKLHDDKGDLELWLAKDRQMKEPIDLPAGSEIIASFLDHSGKTATLRVRNDEQNEDEDGTANMRGGKTNYFIFPGDSGQDPSWLVGAGFKSAVKLTFTANGKSYTSEELVLVPHTHADGHGHTH